LTYVNSDFDQIILDLVKNKNKIAIISGKTSVIKTGFKDKIQQLLKNKNLSFFSEIEENPSINTIIKGGKFIKKQNIDIIIAFGGGSVIDAAKAIALFAENQGSFYEILNSENLKPALPVIAIPTTCGTGSEMNNYAIITDTEN
jgi:alcohol dehydrogenase class IV